MALIQIEKLLNLNDVIFNHYFLIGGLFLSYLIYRILHTVVDGNNFMQTRFKYRGHTWRSIQCNKSIPYNIHCAICGKLMLPVVGLFCECCAVSACKRCYWGADKRFKCKQVTWSEQKPFYHQWVNVGPIRGGNTGQSDEEVTCFFCSWCQRTRRSTLAMLNQTEDCDFQKYKNIIIPPACVQIHKGTVKSVKPLQMEEWEPLIILVSKCRIYLISEIVVDISVTSPESVVQWLPERCRLLVAGGDGTVAWVLNALTNAPHVKAAVAILPMGTGNDLSRVLGWGPGCNSHLDAHCIISSIKEAAHQPLDRWKVSIKPKRSRLGRLRPDRTLFAYNYASVGVDAQVALDFHRARTQFLYRYANRTLNYIAYACLGVGRALDDGGCGGLERRLRVSADGAPLPLPPLQALVALNIPSWGAGVDLWSMGTENEVADQCISDGKLEVVGISSSIHIARLQCGLAEPYRFTQATNLVIELEGSCAMQVDGEPWMQGPATIRMEPAGQTLMLRASNNHCAE